MSPPAFTELKIGHDEGLIYGSLDGEKQDEKNALRVEYVKSKTKENVIEINHTWTPEEWRGRGLVAQLLDYTFDWATQQDLQIVPICSYVRDRYVPKLQQKAQENEKAQQRIRALL